MNPKNNGITAKIILDSISDNGIRLTTMQLRYPRFCHSEFMTHRVFSRNASSSRAIPVKKMMKQVWSDPAMPVSWGENVSGMQARNSLGGVKAWVSKFLWVSASKFAVIFSYLMHLCNLHKQIANRISEPWQYISVIVTSTEWDNFFELRCHTDAQPEIMELAREMRLAMMKSHPKLIPVGEWHLPYIKREERWEHSLDILKKMSAARCARVSYLTHDGEHPSVEKDIGLYDRLVDSHPRHYSPLEHQAESMESTGFISNFRGWKQSRKYHEELSFSIDSFF